MVGYIQSGMFVWTFHLVEKPELTDPHDLVSVTAIEAISATGEAIPSFLIIPGVNIPVKFVTNDLDDDIVITTISTGYITDIIAIEFIKHFERHTRPRFPGQKRKKEATKKKNKKIIAKKSPQLLQTHKKAEPGDEAHKGESPRKNQRHAQTAVIGKLGPLSMRDARLRVAKDQYSRRAAQKEEKERIFKRNTRQEMAFLRRWVAKVRLKARSSLRVIKPSKVKAQDRRAYLDNTSYISQHYALLREICAAEKAAAEDSAVIDPALLDFAVLEDPAITAAKAHKLSYNVSHNENIILWPKEYDEAVVTAAIKLVVSELEKRAASRQLMQFKADIIELMYEIEASGNSDEFVIPKGEGDGLNCTGHDEGVDLSRLGRDDDPDDCSRIDQSDISFLSGDSRP
ncbi:hypothetical protein E4U60_005948 [Claviceps pazoutovae]|uniref:Uncharacterized protein n=1 Tax=Claviceps pazoutovae TaxID=1649127 RepID=A0A9P7SEZ9_9HYPO|nr:hypothetical protein E4U60_005948 [Claviceps pazoutovae]